MNHATLRRLPAALLLALQALACQGPSEAIPAPDQPIALNVEVALPPDQRALVEQDVKRLLDAEQGTGAPDAADHLAEPAAELSADEADVQSVLVEGLVGERYDGLLGFTPGAIDPATQLLVATVNEKRMAAYRAIAAARHASQGDVRALAARARIEGAEPGSYVLLGPGQSWRRR